MQYNNLINRLLRRNISVGQIIGYAVANFVGLVIVLTAMQFYRDVTAARGADDNFLTRDYLIVSRKVSGMGSLLGATATIGASEMADIAAQPWVARMAPFTAAAFNVYASVEMGGRQLSTAMFLESIPDEYFDVKPSEWDYNPDSSDPVPVIISKDYLTLYNFGFAASRGLPQVSEGMVGMVPLRLSLSGNGLQQWVDARIVGFSSRLNTIAVPQSFMDHANGLYAEKELPEPSRLIIEVRKAGDPAIAKYLDEHGLESAGDKVDNGRASYFLAVVTGVVIAVGCVISALALFILLLSLYLLLQKNRDKLHQLMLLGYCPSQVSRGYYYIVAAVNVCVLAGAVAVTIFASCRWKEPLAAIGLKGASPWLTIAAGAAITAFITIVNFVAIRRKVAGAFRL